jgi:exodeoxyribonuclease-3
MPDLKESQLPLEHNSALQSGVVFSELRDSQPDPQRLIPLLFSLWKSERLEVLRSWGGLLEPPILSEYSESNCLLPDDLLRIAAKPVQTTLRIATWNVNSIRSRLPNLLQWFAAHQPDVVGLQETKTEDPFFPREAFENLGYTLATFGQKTYNGVALLSRFPLMEVQKGFQNGYDPENARLISAEVQGLRIINAYVPQGQTVESDKFRYKLEFLEQFRKELEEFPDHQPLLVMGDFNIAPETRDLAAPEAMAGKVSFHPDEHAWLRQVQQLGFTDLFREYESGAGHYSWWDYRTRGFERDEGMRIDYILANSTAQQTCKSCWIDMNPRAALKPSDHAPVICELEWTCS